MHNHQSLPQFYRVRLIFYPLIGKLRLRERSVTCSRLYTSKWENRDSNSDMSGSNAYFFPFCTFHWKQNKTKQKYTWQKIIGYTKENGVSSQPFTLRFLFSEVPLLGSSTSSQTYACIHFFLCNCCYKLFHWNGPYASTKLSYLEFINALGAKLERVLY